MFQRLALFLAALVLAGIFLAPPARAGLFGTAESESRDTRLFKKWEGMWQRHGRTGEDAPLLTGDCRPNPLFACDQEAWDALVEALRGAPLADQLTRINAHMNRSPYIVDPINWGVPDYWATLKEFFRKNGDCEDYAIAKYVTLRALGIDPHRLRIVVVQDENLGVAHAVLSIEANGTFYILDNQVDAVLPHDRIYHYRPIYSISEGRWWLHHART